MPAANIGLRLRHGATYIIVQPSEAHDYNIEIVDDLGHPIEGVEREAALEYLLVNVSKLRQIAYKMLGRKPKVDH